MDVPLTEPTRSESDPQTAGVWLSDEPTLELIARAKRGDPRAVEALLQRCIPSMKRWAHGRLPASARGYMDTGDVVQEVALAAIRRLDTFEPRGIGAMQAYLRQSLINRIRDEVRRLGRRGTTVELTEALPTSDMSPLEEAIQAEAYERYRNALATLRPRDRELVVARIELQWRIDDIAGRFNLRKDAARMAVGRALERLTRALHEPKPD